MFSLCHGQDRFFGGKGIKQNIKIEKKCEQYWISKIGQKGIPHNFFISYYYPLNILRLLPRRNYQSINQSIQALGFLNFSCCHVNLWSFRSASCLRSGVVLLSSSPCASCFMGRAGWLFGSLSGPHGCCWLTGRFFLS